MCTIRRLIFTPVLTALLLLGALCSAASATELSAAQIDAVDGVAEPAQPFWQGRSLVLTPSLGGYAGWLMGDVEGEDRHASAFRPAAWAGATFNMPRALDFAYPYASLLAEVEPRQRPDGSRHAHISPMLHIGVGAPSVEDGATPRYVDHMFAGARMYMMVGIRPAPPGIKPPMRIGMGLSSTWFPIAALQSHFFLPSHYEWLVETDSRGNTTTLLRVGLGF